MEITRRSPQNWSEVELNALKVAREHAKDACLAHNVDSLTKNDLISLARLCAFAQKWQPVYQAASKYIAIDQSTTRTDRLNDSPDLGMAFDYEVQACLSLKNLDNAVTSVEIMLNRVPYDVFASEATNSTVNTIRFSRMPQALGLLKQRQSQILTMIKTVGIPGVGSKSVAGTSAQNQSLSIRALYSDGLALPFLQQLANEPQAAAESYAELDAAVPKAISAEDAFYITEERRQYYLLGKHLPTLTPTGSLLFPGAAPPQGLNTAFLKAAVFFLFPDWCNQCIKMGFDTTAKNQELIADREVRFFNLMAQSAPPEAPAETQVKNVPLSQQSAKVAQAKGQKLHVDQNLKVNSSPDKLLEGTSTLTVPNEVLAAFAATDFPLIIATDHDGVVRWIQHATDGSLDQGGDVDQIVQHILRTWPAS